MNTKTISLFREGTLNFWQNFRKIALYSLLLILLYLALIIIAPIIGALIDLVFKVNIFSLLTRMTMPLIILQSLIFPIFLAGYQYLFVKLLRNESSSFKTIFAGFKHFWPVMISNYFRRAIVFAGVFLFLLPLLIIFFLSQAAELPSIFEFLFSDSFPPPLLNHSFTPAFRVLLVLLRLTFIFATFYWSSKLLFVELAALDRKLSSADAIYYAINISKGNLLKIFLNYLPFIIIIFSINFTPLITVNKLIVSVKVFTWLILLLFIFTPWLNSIIATLYVRLSDKFDENLKEEYLERFTVKKCSRDEVDNDDEDNNEDENDEE
ncbi:MAG TPA: hypothetical protein VKY40_05255 [Halanaerobiales bacterium]|nr:hypothetical protein [Halanaerobiales bacterium]